MHKYIGNGATGHLFTDKESNAEKTLAIAQLIFDESYSMCEYDSWIREFLQNDFVYDYKDFKDNGYYEEVILWFPDFQYDFRGALTLYETECAEFIEEDEDED